jgi:hypothetical protein
MQIYASVNFGVHYTHAFNKSCETCQQSNRYYQGRPTPLKPLPTINYPFSTIHLDMPELSPTPLGKNLLVINDSFSHWPEAYVMSSTKAIDVAKVLYSEYVTRYGFPLKIITDRGANFMAKLVK